MNTNYPFPSDIAQKVRDCMATGLYACEDDLLRDALHLLADDDADLVAIREAIADVKAGDPGLPVDAAFDAIRVKHGIRPKT
jgi:Arc/MetJ-type ribon-helix-helix transcriptional regulator